MRPAGTFLHGSEAIDVHLIVHNPPLGSVQELGRLRSAWHPVQFHVIPKTVLCFGEPSLVSNPVVHLQVDVGMVVRAPCWPKLLGPATLEVGR